MFKKTIFTFFTLFLLSACQPQNDSLTPVEQTACTKEAKLCSDGSSVGRTGPNCEFAACPEVDSPENAEALDATGWKEIRDEASGISFKYPDPLPTKYTILLTDEEFFPHFALFEGDITCLKNDQMPNAMNGDRIIDGQNYCVAIQGDAAAGSAYTTYTYTKDRKGEGNNLISLIFTLRQPNCGNYDEPKKTDCEKEQAEFNPDELAVQILGTINF